MLLFLSLLCIFLSVILLVFNSRSNSSTIYLGFFFLLVSLYSFNQYVLVYSKSVFLISIITTNFTCLFYLIGPMLYWYIRSVLTDDSRLNKKDLWHLLPMIVYLGAALPYIFTSYFYKVEIAKEIVKNVAFVQEYKFTILSEVFSVHAMYLSRPLLVLMYTIWSIGLFINHIRSEGKLLVFSRQHFMIKWLSVLFGFQSILIFSYFLSMLNPVPVFITLNVLQILSEVGFIGLLISPFFFPAILYGLPKLPEPVTTSKQPEGETDPKPKDIKKHTPDFESDYLLSIHQKADSCMYEMQPYLLPDCNLASFSKLIRIPVHHLAYFFRKEKKQSFNDYRNVWRINHAKNLIKAGNAKKVTLEGIGSLSGFSSKNAFFSAFKKAEGISPGTFAGQFAE